MRFPYAGIRGALLLALLSAFVVTITVARPSVRRTEADPQVEQQRLRKVKEDDVGKLLENGSIFEEGLNNGICINRPEGERCYNIFIPSDAPGNIPLVLDFHGSGSESSSQMYMNNFREISRSDKNFVVAWLQGYEKTFNAGVCCDNAKSAGVDDVALVREMIEQILANANVDPSRIYATGYSNGGALAYYLSFRLPEYIAAVATIAYGFNTWLKEEALTVRDGTSSAFHPVPVLSINGSNDQLNCWTGSCILARILDPSGVHLNSQHGWHNWAKVNNCIGEPVTIAENGPSFLPMFDYTDFEWVKAYTNCAGGVEVRQLLNSRNHSGEWLGANGIQTQGNYSKRILEFLFRWRLPERSAR